MNLFLVLLHLLPREFWFLDRQRLPNHPKFVSTKKDKIKRSQVQKQLSVIKKSLNLAPEDKLIAFSGETKEGKDELWAEIERVIGYEEPAKE